MAYGIQAVGQISLGVRAGINMAVIPSYTDAVDQFRDDNRGQSFKYHAGLVGSYPLNNTFNFEPEIMYSRKGVKFKSVERFMDLKMDYIEVPLIIRASYAVTKKEDAKNPLKVSVALGPSIGYWMRAERETQWAGENSVEILDFDNLEGTIRKANRTEFSIVLGAGFDVPVGFGAIRAEARYNLGLTTVDADQNLYNSVTSLSLGYIFPLSEKSKDKEK